MNEAEESLEDGFARVPGGGEIAYQTCGPSHDRDPVLLIRPLGGSMALWGSFRARLAETHRIIAFDHRGSGRSSAAPAITTTKALARDALQVLDHLGAPRAQVFGISLGGMVATWLAILAPSRVSKLCIAAAPARGLALSRAGLRRGLSLAACLAKPRGAIEASLVERILSRHFREGHPEELHRIERLASAEPTSRTALAQLALAAALHDARSELERITAPTLVLAGEHDALLGTEAPRALAGAIRGAKFAIIAGSGHDLTLEQPLATAASVARFFQDRTG
jgi:3-oxoadipate enol-lactonase